MTDNQCRAIMGAIIKGLSMAVAQYQDKDAVMGHLRELTDAEVSSVVWPLFLEFEDKDDGK